MCVCVYVCVCTCIIMCTWSMYHTSVYIGLSNEGWFDPWLFLQAFRKKVVSMGVNFINAEVTGVSVEEHKVKSAKA